MGNTVHVHVHTTSSVSALNFNIPVKKSIHHLTLPNQLHDM
jgi:hypothetical protein